LKPFSWFVNVIKEIVLTSANFWTPTERFHEKDFSAENLAEKVIFWLGEYPKNFFGAPLKIAGAYIGT
jgi:hypothetical protein